MLLSGPFTPLVWPALDPVAVHLGPLALRWYGLSYVVSLVLALSYVKWLARRHPAPGLTQNAIDDAFLGCALGVVVGGRLGYILFYGLSRYLAHPFEVFRVWQGGMSFHGGMLGVILAMVLFSWKKGWHQADLPDRVVCAVPIGLFFGRLANFINGELWGKPVSHPASLPWSMVFPFVDAQPRHPSQLYEAGLEGLLLFAVLYLATRRTLPRWLPSGIFLSGYALSRIFAEIFRVPEIIHPVGPFFISQGQLLCLPMLAIGLWLIYLGSRAPQPNPAAHHPA